MIEGGGVPVYLAFVAGIVSFASACVLPIVPAFSILVGGLTLVGRQRLTAGRGGWTAIRYSSLFILGFGGLFILMSATASEIGSRARDAVPAVEVIGAVTLGIVGLSLAFSSRLRTRDGELGLGPHALLGTCAVGAGAGFAAAWTPCIGPVLAEILLYAAFPSTLAEGIGLLIVYSLGLAVPFLGIAFAVGWLMVRVPETGSVGSVLIRGVGAALVLFAGLLLTGRFAAFTAYLSGYGLAIELGL
ncbi:MAG: hypothetical protein GEU90_10495 [Gemmatimonas sp.]|nr:hypothetical protein [Gemmatimonas sp.]